MPRHDPGGGPRRPSRRSRRGSVRGRPADYPDGIAERADVVGAHLEPPGRRVAPLRAAMSAQIQVDHLCRLRQPSELGLEVGVVEASGSAMQQHQERWAARASPGRRAQAPAHRRQTTGVSRSPQSACDSLVSQDMAPPVASRCFARLPFGYSVPQPIQGGGNMYISIGAAILILILLIIFVFSVPEFPTPPGQGQARPAGLDSRPVDLPRRAHGRGAVALPYPRFQALPRLCHAAPDSREVAVAGRGPRRPQAVPRLAAAIQACARMAVIRAAVDLHAKPRRVPARTATRSRRGERYS